MPVVVGLEVEIVEVEAEVEVEAQGQVQDQEEIVLMVEQIWVLSGGCGGKMYLHGGGHKVNGQQVGI